MTTSAQRAERDTRISELRAAGVTVDAIATEVGCSPRTVLYAAERDIDLALRREARNIASSMVKFKQLITEAKTRNIHSQRGFTSWPAYIADVIGKEMGVLTVDDRRQIVGLLSGEGMSARAIAEAVGVNEITVRRDKAASEVRHDVAPQPDSVPERVTGRDGKSHPAKHKPAPKPPAPTPTPAAVDPDTDACLRCSQTFARVEMYPEDDDAGTVIGYLCEACEEDDAPPPSLHDALLSFAEELAEHADRTIPTEGRIVLGLGVVETLVDLLRAAATTIQQRG